MSPKANRAHRSRGVLRTLAPLFDTQRSLAFADGDGNDEARSNCEWADGCVLLFVRFLAAQIL